MTTAETSTEVVPDWAAGYAMALPCYWKNPKCDNEAEWFASQHGCLKAYVCDQHMIQCYEDVNLKIAKFGAVQCRECDALFDNFPSFIKAVRI